MKKTFLLFSVIVMSLLSFSSRAQVTATIGTGTSSGYTYGAIYRSSASSAFDFSRYHYVYTAAELSAAGISPGSTLSELKFYLNSTDIMAAGDATLNVYVKNSNKTVALADTWANLIAGATLVNSSTYNLVTNFPGVIGWLPFTFSSGVIYTGGSIEVSLDWDCSLVTGNPTTGALNWLYGSAPGTQTTYANNSTLPASTTSTTAFRPNIQFVHTAAACPGTSGLTGTNFTATTADLSWSAVASATSGYNWKVVAGGAGVAGTAVASGTTTNTFVTATGMTAITNYDLYVQTNCGGSGTGIFSGPYNFTTGCVTQMNGVYTIGATGNFTTFSAAVLNLVQCGVSGPVTFNVSAGTYAENITIPSILNVSATNTVTFNGAGATNTTLLYDGAGTANATMTLDGADYFKFKNLKIKNTETVSNGWGVLLTNQADYNTIDSCIIELDTTITLSSLVGFVATGSLTSISTAGNNANFTTISNTVVNGGYYGIRFYGNSTAAADNSSNKVINCNLPNNYYYGIYAYYQDGFELINTKVYQTRNTSSGYGAYFNYVKHAVVTGNQLHGSRTYGIYFLNINTTLQTPTLRALVANNMVSALGSGDCMYMSAATNVDVFFNTFVAENDQALWASTTATGYDIRNNVFATTGTAAPVDLDGTPGATEVIDFNIYDKGVFANIAEVGSAAYSDVAAWVVADATKNANSLSASPVFVSGTDLHMAASVGNNVATPIALITADIDGDARSATTPDIGADEFTPPSCSVTSALTTSNITDTSVLLSWTAGGTESNWLIEWGTSGFIQGAGTIVPVTATSYQLNGLTASTPYDFYVRAICGPGDTSNWSQVQSFSTFCAPYTIPYFEGFETGYTDAADVAGCLSQESVAGTVNWTANNTQTTYNRSPRTGTWNTTLRYGNTDWIFIPVTLVGGTSYTSDIYVRQDGATATNSDVAISYGTANTDAAMTNTIVPATGIINGTYQLLSGTFTPATSGLYFVGIKGYMNSSPWYISLDDIAIYQTPLCPSPIGLSASNISATSGDISWTAQVAATTYNWIVVNAGAGPTGTPVASGTSTNDTTTASGLTANTAYDFYVASDCGVSGTGTLSGPYSFSTLCNAYSIPYFEGFESGYTNGTDVAGCLSQDDVSGSDVWTANNTETTYNRSPRTGAWNAYLRYGNTDWMFIPVNLVGGTSYTTDAYARQDGSGSTNSDISISYGTTNTDAGMTNVIVPTTGIIDGTYQLLTGTFTPATSGVYYVGIKGYMNFSPWYISLDDIEIYETPCDTPTVTVDPISVSICENGSFELTAAATGTGVTYSWLLNGTVVGTSDTLTVASATIADSGAYVFIATGTCGADTSAVAVVTVNSPLTVTDVQTACVTYTWIDGNIYTASNTTATFTVVGATAAGCDSVYVLDLTINPATTSTITETSCGTYTAPSGMVFNSSGTYTDTIANASGCDSVITINLTINLATMSTITESSCGAYTAPSGTVFSASGTYTDTIANASGCDSIITINLTIIALDLTVTQTNGINLSSNEAGIGATYQWIDCGNANAPVVGATSQAFTATANSDYAVIVSKNNCTDTSACLGVLNVGLADLVNVKFATLSPNPTTEFITIATNGLNSVELELLDAQGKVVISTMTINNGGSISLRDFERGMYFVRLTSEKGMMLERIIKN